MIKNNKNNMTIFSNAYSGRMKKKREEEKVCVGVRVQNVINEKDTSPTAQSCTKVAATLQRFCSDIAANSMLCGISSHAVSLP